MAYERDSQEDLVWDSENGEYIPAGGEEFTLTISPTPSDATVTLTAAGYTQSGNSITVIDGTTVSYSVAKTGYTTVYGAVTVTATNTIPVTLTAARPIIEESSIGTTIYDIHGKAIKNKNTVSSDEYIYNWVGTLAQYTAQDIEHTHPDWVCLITDDQGTNAGIGNSYTRAETDALLATKTNKGHEVIEFQAPTAANGYTWYRKYADGWVEQGGLSGSITWNKNGNTTTITLPIPMSNTNYHVTATMGNGSGNWHAPGCRAYPSTTSTFIIGLAKPNADTAEATATCSWEVKGMAA